MEARDTQRDSCPTPSDHAAHAVDEEGDTEEESSDEGDVCGVECECELMVQVTKMMTSLESDVSPQNKASGSASQLWWTQAQQKTSYLQASAIMSNSVQLAGLMRALDFAEPAERESAITVRGSSRFEDGHVAGTTWQVADVKRPLMSVAKMVAAVNRVHLDSKDSRIVRPKGDVIPLRKAGNVFVVDLWVRKDATGRRPGFHRQACPEVCTTDDGQTIRPVRYEGAARERNVVGFDLGRVEDAQEECKVGPHAEEQPNMDCESDGGEDGERVRLLPKPGTPSKAEWERHVESHMPFRDWCRHCVAERGLERRHQRHPAHDDQYPLVCIDYGYLSGDATPMLVAKDRRTGMVFVLTVERKGAADPHAVEQLAAWVDMLGSSQVATRSDGEPAVMQVAAAVKDARRAGSVTTLETSAPGDHAGNGLAQRAVGLVGGMVRTLKNELEFNCQMQIAPESKTIAWMILQATTLLNLDTVGPDGKVPFERWRGRGHHMGRSVFGERVWYRVGPLTDRTKAEDRMEPVFFVGFWMKSSEYILIANGEATTARTIRRRPVPERWTNPEEIVNIPVWPWDRPGHRQAAAVRPMGERRDRNHEPDEALLPKPPAEAGPSKRVYPKQSDFDAHGLTQRCPRCRAMGEGIRAQGHSAICRARMEELLRETAKGQQRLEEAERRTRWKPCRRECRSRCSSRHRDVGRG